MDEFEITRVEARRIFKTKRKNSKGKSETITELIKRFKKEFGALPPNSSRSLSKDGKIKAKTSVKRKSPTYGKKGGAKKPYYYEYRMNRRDNSSSPAYLEKGGKIDYFEYYEKLPPNARKIYDKYNRIWENGDFDYEQSKNYLKEMESIGWTFEYGLDNEPYELRKMAKGGLLSRNKRYTLELAGLTGLREKAVEEFISENQLKEEEVLNIIVGLGRQQIKSSLVLSAYFDGIKSKSNKELLKFAKSEKAMRLAKGGKIGFDALSDKVAKRYRGKKVPSEFQDDYGKTYDKEEAKEVGDKVAAKVYRQQKAKK
jgi:hypothetical protein